MANALFASALAQALQGGMLLTNSIKIAGIDHTDDTPVPATDDFLDDIASGARVFTSGALASKTFTGGVFDAADLSPAAAAVTGDGVDSLVFFDDTPGTENAKDLLIFIDVATGLPTSTFSAQDVNITFDNGTNKIVKLG
jgi:hypothetical protein